MGIVVVVPFCCCIFLLLLLFFMKENGIFDHLFFQITELLSEVQPKKDRNKALDEALHELNALLLSLPDGKKEQEVR